MDVKSLTFLPFPHVLDGERRDGMTHSWPERCSRCDRQCEDSESSDIEQCSYGVNFLKVDESLLIAGVVTKDDSKPTVARSKMLRVVGSAVVPRQHLLAVKARAQTAHEQFEDEVEKLKSEVVANYRDSEGYKTDIVNLLKPSLEQTFAQVHDYRQLISQIIQHVNVLLVTSNPGADLDTQLAAASPSVRSIYWAARLMEFKLDSALFLAYPERIHDPQRKRAFRLHGAVKKYLGIYEPLIERKGLQKTENGQSYAKIEDNPDAVGVIPHAFIDNAIKYAPEGSEITTYFTDDADTVTFSVTSLGPQITQADSGHIFELFYRGSEAKGSQEDGTGFGLGLAQHVAHEIRAELSYHQAKKASQPGYYATTFVAKFRQRPEEQSPALYRARARSRGGIRY